jgi:hypothetical protein
VDAAWAITARPDGGLYVFGETCDADYEICQFGLAAYNSDGSLEESFGNDGLVTTNVDDVYSVYAWPTRNILQPDGKLVAGGIALYGSWMWKISLAVTVRCNVMIWMVFWTLHLAITGGHSSIPAWQIHAGGLT